MVSASQNPGRDGLIYLIEEQSNPSAEFFVLPVLAMSGHRVVRCAFADLPVSSDLSGSIVIFVRYVPPAWARLVEEVRPSLDRLIFFMDDDLLDVHASAGMPWRYRFKLARLAGWRKHWLRRQGAELWVSTPYLQKKYEDWRPRLLLPSPVAQLSEPIRFFYHGTASHMAEIYWLRSIVEEVLRRDERLFFEIVGGQEVYSLYRGLPRVTVVHPMKWPAYQAFLAMPGRHIGLAPQLDLPFNRGRSYTKFFDITNCGAVGIYSPGSACSEVVSHGQDGLIVPLEQEVWGEVILHLARNVSLRQTLLRNAEEKLSELGEKAQQSYPGVINSQSAIERT